MKTIEYPLLCWKLAENAILGILVGVRRQLVSDDVRGLTAAFSEYIEKKMQKEHYFYELDIQDIRLKTLHLPIRPNYVENERIYPVNETVELQIPLVFGSNPYGYYECFLPTLERSFYFYSEKDLDRLAEHFARDILKSYSPSQIYNYLIHSSPWLEIIHIKVPKQKEWKEEEIENHSAYKNLKGIAENLPLIRQSGSKTVQTVWERGDVVQLLADILLKEKSNVLLVGKSGVGKSVIIQEAIRKITQAEKSKDRWERHTFWRTTPSRMIGKARYLGEWEELCEGLVEDLEDVNGVVWIENFIMLPQIGGEGVEDSVAAFLSSFIKQGRLRIISELTREQLDFIRKIMPGFVEYFRILNVEEMDAATTLRLFDYYNQYTTKNLQIAFSQKAIEMSYVLLDRFIRYQSFPGKAIHFLNNCLNKALLNKTPSIEVAEIIQNFTDQTGMPEFLLRDDQLLDDSQLKDFFLTRIKGQDQVIDKINSIIKVFKTGLNDPNKPVATLIFAGPTGVGKTATAKALADYFFGKGQISNPLIRLDMSEFQLPSQIYRLIGANGKLVQEIRDKPFSVLLLDEIEKANPLIFDALLTVLDEGILMDSTGRITDFRNTIIIMTSNLGTTQRASLGFKQYQNDDFESSIRSFFRPEFVNRIDQILLFQPLDKNTVREITLKELYELEKRDGIKDRKIKLNFTEKLLDFVAETGFDIRYGARPLQREIERWIIAPLAHLLIQKPYLAHQTLVIDFDGEQVNILELAGD